MFCCCFRWVTFKLWFTVSTSSVKENPILLILSLQVSQFMQMTELWTENHVSSQEMSLAITLSLIDLEVLKFDHFNSVGKNIFSKTSLSSTSVYYVFIPVDIKWYVPCTLWYAVYLFHSYEETYHSGPLA